MSLKLLTLLIAAMTLQGCESEPPLKPGKPSQPDTPVVTPSGDDENGGQTDKDGFQRIPLQSSVTDVQPMTGLVLWNTSGSRDKDYVQLEYSYMLYSDVCKKQDEFDWSPMDKLLSEVAARKHQAVVRFRYTYPGRSCAVPEYIKDWPGYEATNAKSEGRNTEFPDWRCEELRRFHKEFHRRFAERYDQDPRLAFVETGFGLWAEYHIYDGPFVLGRTFPSKEFQAEFLREMAGWFQHTPWCISIDAADSKYGPFHNDASLLDLCFGNFDDSFMCEDHDDYNTRSWKFFGQDRYQRAPFGGEFSYYTSSDQKHCLDANGMYGRVFEDEVAKFHMTFIIGNDQPGKQTDKRLKEASMSMGYRFTVRDFRIKKGEEALVVIANDGVAPIYRDAYVAVAGVRGTYNLRELMPGKEARIHIPCDASAYSVPVIECDHLVQGQKIQYQASIE